MADLHKRLLGLRKLVPGLSNSELDRLCKLRKGHTRALEKNEHANPELKTLEGIARTFGVAVGYLATGEGFAPVKEHVTASVAAARERYETDKEASADAVPEFPVARGRTGTDGAR